MGKVLVAFVLVMGALFLSGCRGERPDDGKIHIVTTTGMVADMAQNICGDLATVESLMGPGIDPHYYKATAGDVQKLSQADLIVASGLHLEGRMGEVFESMADKYVAVGESVASEELIISDGQPDPHVWHDPKLWAALSERVAETLAAKYPQHAEAFQRNADAYVQELDALDTEIEQMFTEVPAESRVLVTAHDAFQYFGKRYDVTVTGVQGTNTTAEASARHIQELAEMIVERKIKAIFVESSVSPATIRALQEAVRSRGWDVKVGGELFSDALGSAGTPEETYIGTMRHNATTIAGALK